MTSERGEMNLIGLLVAMSLGLMVLGATLTLFTSSVENNRSAQVRNEAQDRARVAVDGLARQLRNLASPSDLTDVATLGQKPTGIDVTAADELVFKIVNPLGPNTGANVSNVERLRYCFDRTNRVLWRQEQTWTSTAAPPAVPSRTACPGTTGANAWDAGKNVIVAGDVTNYTSGLNRPIFTYDATTANEMSGVHVDLFVDLDPVTRPKETVLSTGVDLRNQNGWPTAAFTWSFSADKKTLILNGSTSTDPEGAPLQYCWYEQTKPTASPAPASPCSAANYLARGISVSIPSTVGTVHKLWLEVNDGGGLADREPEAAGTFITITNS
jgi:hypothetical protein